jgi:hypothetical protein
VFVSVHVALRVISVRIPTSWAVASLSKATAWPSCMISDTAIHIEADLNGKTRVADRICNELEYDL